MSTITGKALDLHILKRVLGYAAPYKFKFWFTALLTVLLGLFSMVRPLLIMYAVDNYIIIPDLEGLLNITMLLIGLLILEAVFQFYQTYFANWLGQTVIKDLRTNLYHHVLAFRLKYFDKTPIGTLVTRHVSDIETIADIFSQGILTIMGDILKLILVVSAMFYLNWKLTLVSLTSIPLLLIATAVFKKAIKTAFQDVRTQVAKLNAFVQEHITGMSVVQIFNREQQEMDKFMEINKKHRDAHIRSVWAYSIFFPVVEILSAMSLALMVWWGAGEAIEGETKFGTLFAFILFIHMLFRPIRQLADRFNVLQMGMVASERVFKVLDTNSTIEATGETQAIDLTGNIQFNDVWFAYNEPEWVLKGMTFEAQKGQTVALVGATGAGKTSVINLLSRFYEYQKGSIQIDGVDIRKYHRNSLRKSVGLVLQDVFLFSDSILNNITLNDSSISKEQVVQAAKVVGAHDFIQRLPNNYDFNVMERGAVLSVGQRQLIAFIRAYVYNPSILVLDEATSSVDTESEELIQNAIAKLTENRTSIIIAHRLATIQKANKIIVLEKGTVKETGNHHELLAQNGHYKRLYELQFKE